MSRRVVADEIATVNLADFTRTRDSVSYLVACLPHFHLPADAAPHPSSLSPSPSLVFT